MSFTSDVKEELSQVKATCSHCDKATLAALIRIEGTLYLAGKGQFRLEASTDLLVAAIMMERLLHNIYSLKTELTIRRSVLHKTPNYLINVPMQPGLQEALKDMGVLGVAGFTPGVDKQLVAKNCCTEAYLRGAFLGSGFISSPSGDFHFELTVESEQLAKDLIEMLQKRGISARYMQRRSNYIVYMKSGTAISEFLALVGAHKSALAMENERVIKSVRNDVNRRVNAEFANEKKALNAGMDQIHLIRKVVEHYGMSSLSPALQEFILLRVANPQATLKELGMLADPPLSKSAVYHRVRRIEQMAAEINK